MKKSLFIIGLGLLAVLLSFAWYRSVYAPIADRLPITFQSPDGRVVSLNLEAADESHEREEGLMFRKRLSEGDGMIFVYDQSAFMNFWMKNTLIPLDILFFNEDNTFISRTTMQPCVADPCEIYESGQPARYAIEVNAHEPLTREVGEGWKIVLGK